MRKLPASERLKKTKPYLAKRRFGLPFIGDRNDSRKFNPTVEKIKQAIDFYGFKVRDKKIEIRRTTKHKRISTSKGVSTCEI